MDKVIQLSWEKRIVPTCYEQNGGSERLHSTLTIDIRPKGISIRVLNPILEEVYVCTRSPPICVEQRESAGRSLHLVGRRPIGLVSCAMAPNSPAQRAIERECAAGIEHIVKVCTGEVDHERGRTRRRLIGDGPLCLTKGRTSPSQDVAIEPRLPG